MGEPPGVTQRIGFRRKGRNKRSRYNRICREPRIIDIGLPRPRPWATGDARESPRQPERGIKFSLWAPAKPEFWTIGPPGARD